MEQSTQQQGINRPHNDIYLLSMQAAREGFLAKHPDTTEADVERFMKLIELSMQSSQSKGISRQSRKEVQEIRTRRRLELAKIMKEHGIKMMHARSVTVEIKPSVNENEKPDFEANWATNGGISIAYKIQEEKLIVAAGICSRKDRFTYLDGRENAIERFLKGEVLTYDVTDIRELDPTKVQRDYQTYLQKKIKPASSN